jgi:hypothetical protein
MKADKIEFVLELTRKEAVALCLIRSAASGDMPVSLFSIARALQDADGSLDDEQFEAWKGSGRPGIDFPHEWRGL